MSSVAVAFDKSLSPSASVTATAIATETSGQNNCNSNSSTNTNTNSISLGVSGSGGTQNSLIGIGLDRSSINNINILNNTGIGTGNSMDIGSSPVLQPYGHGHGHGSERERDTDDPNMEVQTQNQNQVQEIPRERERDREHRERDRERERLHLSDQELRDASKDRLVDVYYQLQKYLDGIQQKSQDEISQLRESEEKLRVQQLESSRRENVLVMRLTMKEHEVQEYASQLNELKSMMIPSTGTLRSTLLDPAVNLLILRMKKELEDTKKKLEDTQNDLNAWKFTPDSNTGKRLMAKCRMLYQENEELGKMITSGRVAKLETDLALQKSLTEEMRKAQAEMDDVVQELDEDIDGMQSTICFWQEQLKAHQQEKSHITNMDPDSPATQPQQPPPQPPPRHHHHHHHVSSSPPRVVPKDRDRDSHSPVKGEVDSRDMNENEGNDGDDSELEPLEIDVDDHDDDPSIPRRTTGGPGSVGSGSVSGSGSSDSFSPSRTRSEPLNMKITSASSAHKKQKLSLNANALSESDTKPLALVCSSRSLNTSSSMDGISDGDEDD